MQGEIAGLRKVARAFSFLGKSKKEFSAEEETRRAQRGKESAGEREDEQIALAGDDDGERAAVGRDGEVAEAEAV
jgi:hypothetical protein